MIHDVDESLRNLLRRDALEGTDVEVVLDAPTKEWSSRRNAPSINLYLYDIREGMKLRQEGRVELRDETGRITGRRPPIRLFRLSYLVSAWTQRPEDEHRLLSSVLACVLGYDTVPQDVLAGSLVDIDFPLEMSIARPPPEERAISDIWSALGGELKPSLDLVVLAPMMAGQVEPAAELVRETPRLLLSGGGSGPSEATGGSLPDDAAPDGAAAASEQAVPEETVTGGTEPDKVRVRGLPGAR